MIFSLVRDLAAEGVPVAVTSGVLGFSRQAFYAWCASPVSARDPEEAHLVNAAMHIHTDDPEFGYRFIADGLSAAGHQVSERRVWRLCSPAGLFSVHSRRRGRHAAQRITRIHGPIRGCRRRRRQRALGRLTPIEFETICTVANAA